MVSAPVSLYFQLEPDRTADLEVIARASLAFSAAVKELAFILDPSVAVRLELASGTPGSLSLNSIIRFIQRNTETAGGKARAGVVTALLSFFGPTLAHDALHEIKSWVIQKGLDQLAGDEKVLSKEETERLAEEIARILQKKTVAPQMQQFYREIERDTAITGVGITRNRGEKPREIVPRSEFAVRSGRETVVEKTERKREKVTDEHLIVIRPVLLPGPRRWKFMSMSMVEFGAAVKDSAFLEAVLRGKTLIPMVAGIELDVELQTVEEFSDGVWVPAERNVLRVINIHPPSTPVNLDLFAPRSQ